MSVEHLKAGDKVINSDGSLVIVERIESLSYNEGKAIYNLNVEDNHTYFVSEEKVCVHNNCMVSSEKVESIFNAIPKSTPKDISWNDFQTLMKGEGNTAEKAEAYFKFVGRDSKSINNVGRSTGNSVGKVTEGITQAEEKTKVPTVKSGEFNDWFNSLSVDELDSMWQNKSTRRAIERQLRVPGGMHEWHLVSRAPQFKNWGVNAEQIRDLRTSISDVEFINPVGKHGQLGSTTAHNELLGIIDSSIDYDMFTRRLNNWANYRLKGGVDALPEGLRLK